jgi:stearoyl-CoA desaturase (delta-9 desaturase)
MAGELWLTLFLGFFWFQIIAHVGISAGIHRYFAHRAFKAGPIFEVTVLYLTLLAGSRSPIGWIATHRMHHIYSDTDLDPHSPKYKGFWTVLFSQWDVKNIERKYVRDIFKNPRIKFFHKYWKQIWIISGIISAVISPWVFLGFIVIPAILGHIGFGLVNALTHNGNTVKNVPIINILTAGEGYHAEHHEGKNLRFHKYDLTGFILEKLKVTK